MSRDPNAGVLINPKSLHKYLYADGDPVNGMDPRGREDLIEYSTMLVQKLEDVAGEEIYAKAEEVLWCKAFDIFEEQLADVKFPWWYCEAGSY